MSTETISVRLTTNGMVQRVLLNKQLAMVQHVFLEEVLAVGFNGGVPAGVIIRIKHPQLSNVMVHDRAQDGTTVLISPLTPHMKYENKLMLRGEIATVNQFEVTVELLDGTPAVFTELYLLLKLVCRPDPTDRFANAMQDVPQIKGPDPRQVKFL